VGKNKKIGRVPDYYFPDWMYDTAYKSDDKSSTSPNARNIYAENFEKLPNL